MVRVRATVVVVVVRGRVGMRVAVAVVVVRAMAICRHVRTGARMIPRREPLAAPETWYRVQGTGCRVYGAGCRVQGAGCRSVGTRYHVPCMWGLGKGAAYRCYRVQRKGHGV